MEKGVYGGCPLCPLYSLLVQLIDNNFLWSVPLSTLEMASKSSKLRWNHDPQAGGFTAKFVFCNNVDSFCQDVYYLAICKIAGKADREKLHENCVGAPGESLRSGARKLCFHTSFRYTSPLYTLWLFSLDIRKLKHQTNGMASRAELDRGRGLRAKCKSLSKPTWNHDERGQNNSV